MTAAALGYPITGKITSWKAAADTTSFCYLLINSNLLANTANLTVNGEQGNVTTFSASGTKINTFAAGLKNWAVDMEFQLGTPRIGNLGSVTYATMGGAEALLKEWEIQIKAASGDITPLNSTWRFHAPGAFEWSAKAKGYLDAAILAIAPNLAAQPNTCQFNIDATTKYFTGSVIGKSTKITNKFGSVCEVDYDFQGSGALTTAGAGTYLWAAGANTITVPETGKILTFQAASGQVFVGEAQWTDITITNNLTAGVSVKVKAVGSDALTGLTV